MPITAKTSIVIKLKILLTISKVSNAIKIPFIFDCDDLIEFFINKGRYNFYLIFTKNLKFK
jgi:hypothetical protein